MFKDHAIEAFHESSWQAPSAAVVPLRGGDAASAFVDRSGELSPVYREIARRIARNAFTTHVSTLGLGAA